MSERRFPDMWVDPEEDPRETGDEPVGELATVWDYLRRYRLTLEMKCADLDAAQLAQRSVPPSTMSLLGLVRHLAQVEHNWFQRVLQGRDVPRLYRSATDRDHDFNGAVADPAVVDEAWTTWRTGDEPLPWSAHETLWRVLDSYAEHVRFQRRLGGVPPLSLPAEARS